MISFLGFSAHLQIFVQLALTIKSQTVNTGKHFVLFVASPVSASQAVQFPRVGFDFFHFIHMAAAAKVGESASWRTGSISGELLPFLRKFINQFQFVLVIVEQLLDFCGGELRAFKVMPGR